MTFDPTIPGATDIISQSQGQILTNFSATNTLFNIDHVTFNDSATLDRGKHRKSTYVEQGADPVNDSDEVSVYCKDVAGASRLFLRLEGAAGQIIPFTPLFTNSVVALPTIHTEYAFSFGGVQMKWGYVTGAVFNNTIPFATPFPTALRTLQLTVRANASSSVEIILRSSTAPTDPGANTGFSIQTNVGPVDFFYFAIGD